MADTNNTRSPERSDSTKGEQGKNDKMSQSGKDRGSNQTMQHEQAKATVSGGGQSSGQFRGQSGAREQGSQSGQTGQFSGQSGAREQGGTGSDGEKSAIGGGDTRSDTGEPGRARSELDQDQRRSETSKER